MTSGWIDEFAFDHDDDGVWCLRCSAAGPLADWPSSRRHSHFLNCSVGADLTASLTRPARRQRKLSGTLDLNTRGT